MEVKISVEKYFMNEVIATLCIMANWLSGENRNQTEWKIQLNKLKNAFRLFMLEAEIIDFKDLKLPNGRKPKNQGGSKNRISEKPLGWVIKIKRIVRRILLFFLRLFKKKLLTIILLVEFGITSLSSVFKKKHDDFENRIR